MRIVVDMDEVMAQFVAKVLRRWNALSGKNFTRDDITSWRMEEVLGADHLGRTAEGLIDEWLAEDGFFEDLDPVPGAIEAVNKMRAHGYDVVFATSIPEVAVHSYTGKRRWLRKHFPHMSMKDMIAVSRKELIDGDILIDDGAHNIEDWVKARKEGAVIFDAPWNRHIGNYLHGIHVYRAMNWNDALNIVSSEYRSRLHPYW